MSFTRLSSLNRVSRAWPKAAAPRPSSILTRLYSAQAIENVRIDDSSFVVQGRRDASSLLVNSNWTTLEDQPLTGGSVKDLIENTIPSIRRRNFLSKNECSQLVGLIQQHQIVSSKIQRARRAERQWTDRLAQGSYNQRVVFPPLGSVGLTQFDHQKGWAHRSHR